MIDRLLSYVAPHNCASCGQQGSILCDQCKYDIVSEPPVACLLCFMPAGGSNLCARCRSQTGIEDAWYVVERREGIKRLIDNYKFHSALEVSRHMAHVLDSRLPLLRDVVVTVAPTPPAHRRVRGFDHAERLGRQFARSRSLPYDRLLRRLSADAQHLKSRSDRFTSAARSIEAAKSAPESVLLIDDILTTGATVAACVKRLKESGAQTVYVAIFARQPYRK